MSWAASATYTNMAQQLQLKDIKTILILGAGTMGYRIGLQAALSGFNVTIFDVKEEAFPLAQKFQGRILKDLLKRGIYTQEQVDAALARQRFTTDAADAAKDADLVSESVTEDLELKKKVWAQFNELCPPHTVFTSNTSYLLTSWLKDASGRPDRFCNYHFHDVFLANVVDIMPSPDTEQWVVDLLFELGRSLRQTPVLIKREWQGYAFNHILGAVLGAAGELLVEDVASVEDIDRSWMGNWKMDIGPFGIYDSIGLDTAYHVMKNFNNPRLKKFCDLLAQMMAEGKYGIKSGEGFYKYPGPKFNEPGFVKGS